jgi:hypothetical protein
MILIIIATLLVLAVAAFHFAQGLFSSIIMAVLATLCAVLALNFYQPLAEMMFPKHSAWAEGVMLALLFGLPLGGLRVGFDYLARKNVIYSVWVDRIGGGVAGLWVGLMVTGILMICFQLLPFDASILTYKPYSDTLQRQAHLGPFAPDELVLNVASALSGGSLSGRSDFAADHDNFVLMTFTERNRAGRPANRVCLEDQFHVLAAYELAPDDPWLEQLEDIVSPTAPAATDETRIVIVRIAVGDDLQSRFGNTKFWVLPATNFRLVGPDDTSAWPVAYLAFPNETSRRRLSLDRWHWEAFTPQMIEGVTAVTELAVVRPGTESVGLGDVASAEPVNGRGLVVDWVYRLPRIDAMEGDEDDNADADEAADAPAMTLVFRRGVQADLPAIQVGRPPVEGALSFNRAPRR